MDFQETRSAPTWHAWFRLHIHGLTMMAHCRESGLFRQFIIHVKSSNKAQLIYLTLTQIEKSASSVYLLACDVVDVDFQLQDTISCYSLALLAYLFSPALISSWPTHPG